MTKFEERDKSSKDPMSPEKIGEHEPTAVEKSKRSMHPRDGKDITYLEL